MKKWVFILVLLSFTSELVSTLLCNADSFSYTISDNAEDASKKIKEEDDHKKKEDFFQDFHMSQQPIVTIILSYRNYEETVLHQAYTPPTPPPNKA